MKMRKKPVVVDVSEPWLKIGDHPDVTRYVPVREVDLACDKCSRKWSEHGWVGTLEGGHRVCPGDRIVTGIENEQYPIKPNIYEKTYGPVELTTDEAEVRVPQYVRKLLVEVEDAIAEALKHYVFEPDTGPDEAEFIASERRKLADLGHACAVHNCNEIQEGAVHFGKGVWVQFCPEHHDLFHDVFARVTDGADYLGEIHEALLEAGYPTVAPTPGPDGDEGVSHVDQVKCLAHERDRLLKLFRP